MKGAPKVVRNIDISDNLLTNINFLPEIILEDLTCRGNLFENLNSLGRVYGAIYADDALVMQHNRRVAIANILS